MDIEAFRAQHPEAFAAAYAAGRQAGVDAERDRYAGHIRAAQLSGAYTLAFAAIADGRDVGALATEYLEAGMRRRMIADRSDEEFELSLAADGALGTRSSAAQDAGDAVAQAVIAGIRADAGHAE